MAGNLWEEPQCHLERRETVSPGGDAKGDLGCTLYSLCLRRTKMIEVSSYRQLKNTIPLIEGGNITVTGKIEDPITYRFPTWRGAMTYIEELLEKNYYIVSAIQVEEEDK